MGDCTAAETDPPRLGNLSDHAPHPCQSLPPGGYRSEARRRSTRARSGYQFGCVYGRCTRQASDRRAGVGGIPAGVVIRKRSTRRQETPCPSPLPITSYVIGARMHLNVSTEYSDDLDRLLADSALAAIDPEAPWIQIETALRSLTATIAKADPLRRAMVREAAIRRLRTAGVHSPATLA